VKSGKLRKALLSIFLGNRYFHLTNVKEQVRYMTMNWIFMVAIFPLVLLGMTQIGVNLIRVIIDFGIAFLCLAALIMIRSKIPLKYVPVFPVTVFAGYCCYLVYLGDLNFWAAVWLFSLPPITIFLCQMTVGVIHSSLALIASAVFMFTNVSPSTPANEVSARILGVYILIFALSVIYERISVLKDRKENELLGELSRERDMIQTMKDNINQGIFLMDKDLNILPQYSSTLVTILSYYDSELTGKNFLDILSASLDSKQLQVMKGYFSMIFAKEKSAKILDSANPISDFEYKIDNDIKYLSTRFQLIDKIRSDPVIIGIIQDITREKEIEKELHSQKEVQEREIKNLFDILKIDPLVFQNFIEDTEANFNNINLLLKDRSLTEKQVVTKIFQYVHGIKSNALILDLESLANKLHVLEDDVKAVSGKENVSVNDILSLAVKIEQLMQEMDSYVAITKKISAYKTTNQIDTILISSLSKAAQRLSEELNKKVKVMAGQIDLGILESKLRKPVKDILNQCLRNSIYHGIELPDERIKKNKSPQGLLTFSVKNVNGKAEVLFADDGRGLDWEKIKEKYTKKNPGKPADKNILLNSIFAPEFSTADETSTAAGRGVGLSFVKDIVKECGGTINVNSTENGSSFKFTFPLGDTQKN